MDACMLMYEMSESMRKPSSSTLWHLWRQVIEVLSEDLAGWQKTAWSFEATLRVRHVREVAACRRMSAA